MYILYPEVIVTEHLWPFGQSKKTEPLGKLVIFTTGNLRNALRNLDFLSVGRQIENGAFKDSIAEIFEILQRYV